MNPPGFLDTPDSVEVLRDHTDSYDIVWGIIVLLGVLAMEVDLLIDHPPLARFTAQPA